MNEIMTQNDGSIKIIIVDGCLNCPYNDIRNPEDDGGELWCGDKQCIGKMREVCSPDFVNKVYEECDLTDISEFGPDVENFVRYCYG